MTILIQLLLNTIAVFVSAYLVPGVTVIGFVDALIAAVVLGVLNAVLKPILKLLTFPITFLTMGLFSIVINVLILALTDYLVPGLTVEGLVPLVMFGLVLGVLNWFFDRVS